MITFNEMKVQEIMQDESLSRDQKIQRLRVIETEARALERAASESMMNPEDGWDADLRQVRLALDRLGAKEPPKNGATL